MNKATIDAIQRLEKMPVVISTSTAAKVLHIDPVRFRGMLSLSPAPYAVETTVEGEKKRHFKIYTERLIQWLIGTDIRKR